MSGYPLFSVVIPVRNGAAFIEKGIDSVLAQDHKAHEIIVVDDGSTDETSLLLERYAGRIRAMRQPHSGVSAARNAGLRAATGTHVALLDHDDWWFRHHLRKHAESIARWPKIGFMSGNYIEQDRLQGFRRKKHFQRLRLYGELNFDAPLGLDSFTTLLRENVIGFPSAVVLRRDVIERAGWFDPDRTVIEDYDYYLRCATLTGLLLISDVLAYKTTHSANLSRDAASIAERHCGAIEKALRERGGPVEKRMLGAVARASLSRSYFYLGNLRFETGEPRKAFGAYWKGLTCHRTPVNFFGFLFLVLKKAVRLVTGATSSSGRSRVSSLLSASTILPGAAWFF